MTESFAGYGSLGWHLWSIRVCNVSIQALLDFRVSTKKSGFAFVEWVFLFPLWISESVTDICCLFFLFAQLMCSQGVPCAVGDWDTRISWGRKVEGEGLCDTLMMESEGKWGPL